MCLALRAAVRTIWSAQLAASLEPRGFCLFVPIGRWTRSSAAIDSSASAWILNNNIRLWAESRSISMRRLVRGLMDVINYLTPGELKSSARPISETCWRVVEAQHLVSTMKLTDLLEDQQIPENLIEETKPTIPEECRHLDFLLFTPFRYSASNPRGSRFRRPFAAHGVFYAAQHPQTAIAETVFYRNAVLRGISGDAVARKSGRVHSVRGRVLVAVVHRHCERDRCHPTPAFII